MTALELLSNLSRKDIEIWADGDRLRYNAPKGTLTPDLRKELAARKPEILALLRQANTVTSLASLPLKPVSRDGDLPLSFAQERLWFLHYLEPDSAAYNMPRSTYLKGVLKKDALEKAYVELARRHETLRTTFRFTDGNPVLRIATEPNIAFDTLDLRHLPEVQREAEAKRLSAKDARKPFDLKRGPLFRIRLFQLEDEAHVLHFNMHHIISDFWSFGVMAQEIAALYTAFINGKPADLSELPVQYADYAVWQRQWLQDEALEGQLNYWKDKLGGELPVLELPTDRPRPAVQTHRGATVLFALPKELTDALQALSRREGVTLFMTLLAAFKTLLYRLTGQEDTIVGTPIAGRNRTELEGLIGFFMNTIVMRTDLSGNPTFRKLLGRVRETALGAYAHQDMPFERLVEELSPERDLSRTPLFQIFFNYGVAMEDKAAELPGLETEAVGGLNQESKFDMTLHVLEGEGGLAGKFEYNTDLFDAERIERLIGHFQTLLEGIVSDSDQHISELALLTEEERSRLLVEFNASEKDLSTDKTLVQLFEEQVERSPEAVAVEYKGKQLTYCELNSRANQLAHHLMALGVGPEVMVGLFMERSLEMVIGIYGIIKAGGAYVPLDPEYPSDRIGFMIEDTDVPILLTQEKLAHSLPEQRAKVLCLDSEWNLIGGQCAENPTGVAAPGNLAYVIYTSGSTGWPKGVMNEHRGIVNRLLWMQEEYRLTPADRVLQKTPFSFDVSVWEFFWPLQTGASLIIAKPGGHRDSAYLSRLIIDQEITTLHFVPSMLRVFLEESEVERCTSIKRVICSGEALPFDLQQRFFERLDTELHNLYGPTEAAVDVTYWPCRADSDRSMVPIGYPVANTQIYILDPRLFPVPIGYVGELHIGGVQVARGYLNRSELSTEKFIPDPFSDDPAARLYKTGDLAKYLVDGSIEYMGRIDFQVKMRGLRVELGEIETRLAELDAVEKCIVVVREDRAGDQRLVAYYVLKPESEVSLSDWRNYLRSKLPDYMVPQHFVKLEAIPLTPNGKIDRKVLPAPDRDRGQPAKTLVSSRDELELQLTKIWEKVLGVKNIGVKDNFFDLGGHSLLVMQLFARIQKIFGRDLPLATLFQAPTVEQLGSILRQKGWSSPWSSLVPMQHSGSKPPFFCIHGCTGKVLHFYDLARILEPEQPFYGLGALGLEKGQVPHSRFEDMAAHYNKEIRTIQFNGPYYIGGSGDGCAIAIEMAHQLKSQGQNVALLVLIAPTPLKPNKSYNTFSIYRMSAKKFFRLLIGLMKKRPLLSNIRHAFLNRVLWHWKIFQRFLPGDIHRWRRFIDDFSRARKNYEPKAYHGRITCLLGEEYSQDHEEAISDWYDLTVGALDIRFVPGTIISMWRDPHVQILAEQLKACLEEAQKDSEE